MEEKQEKIKAKDRKLGDEWENWTGSLDESKTYNESVSLFARYALLAVIVLLAALVFVLYMIEPRLNLINPVWVTIAKVFTGAVIISSVFIGALAIASVISGRNILLNHRLVYFAVSHILPIALAIAKKMGVSRDRLGNSFVAFSNAIVRGRRKKIDGKTIVLLPRCLNAETKKTVKEMCGKVDIGVFSATGGGQARKIIREERPSAIIGVACERDLVSGINDVAHMIPTIGVANKRPEGPCKNTIIDFDDLREAIRVFTGETLD